MVEEHKNIKKNLFLILGLIALIGVFGGLTYAFFNYTKTGNANTFKTGIISFSTTEDTITLTNVFPITWNDAINDTVNTDKVEIGVVGNTNYNKGLEYLVTVEDSKITVGTGNNEKLVPIQLLINATNLGTKYDILQNDYWNNRAGNTAMIAIPNYTSENGIGFTDFYDDGQRVAVGYIPSGTTGVNGTITIKAYIPLEWTAISDTYDENETTDNMGTTDDWVDGRTVLTTEEWNSLGTTPISFKVRIEANEGTWVEDMNGNTSPSINP